MAESNHPDIHMPSPRYATKKRNTMLSETETFFCRKEILNLNLNSLFVFATYFLVSSVYLRTYVLPISPQVEHS
jgi:hypothetical protein